MWLLIIVLLSSQVSEGRVGSKLLITEERVDRVRIGMGVDSLGFLYDPAQSIRPAHDWDEAYYSPILYIVEKNKKMMRIMIACYNKQFIVSSVLVLGERYKTVEGIGVGSTLGELKQVYSVKDIYEKLHSPYYTLRVELRNSPIGFFLNIRADDLDLPTNYYLIDDIIPFVPDSSKIEAIWIRGL